ncbi:hypothetical protein RJ641_004907 [Dillenia turbinata]|uniref:Uncharacterized protein n=1 Tax=Dillenia turbinata TaxID=194707 RepID=A0AAN8VG24_9MAGN
MAIGVTMLRAEQIPTTTSESGQSDLSPATRASIHLSLRRRRSFTAVRSTILRAYIFVRLRRRI